MLGEKWRSDSLAGDQMANYGICHCEYNLTPVLINTLRPASYCMHYVRQGGILPAKQTRMCWVSRTVSMSWMRRERRHVRKSEQTCCHKCLSQHTCQGSLLCLLCHFHFVNPHLQKIKCLWTAWWRCLTALPERIQVKMFLSPLEPRNAIIIKNVICFSGKHTRFW